MVVRLSDEIFDVRLSSTQKNPGYVTTFLILWHDFIFFSIFPWSVHKLLRAILTAAHHGDWRTFLFAGRAPPPPKNLVLSEGIAPNASIKAIKPLGSTKFPAAAARRRRQ